MAGLGLPRFSPARLALAFGLLIVAIGLGIAGFVALVDALRVYLLLTLGPILAHLLVGLLLLLLAGALCLIAYRLSRPLAGSAGRRQARDGADVAAAEAMLWVRRHPGQSAILAAVLGFCAGAWPEARKAMSAFTKPER